MSEFRAHNCERHTVRHPKSGYVMEVNGSPDLYYVRAVPKDVRGLIPDVKSKWTIPLGTNSKAKALPLARALAVEHDALIARARHPDPLASLSADERKEVEERGGIDAYKQWLESLSRDTARLTDEAASYREWAAAERPAGPELEPQVDPVWARGQAGAALAMAEENRLALASGLALVTKVEDLKSTPALADMAAETVAGDPLTLAELCEKYLAARNPRNQGPYRNVVMAFERLNGRLLLKDITKKHVRTYRDSLPSAGYIETTAKGCFKKLKTMFRFAVEDDYLQTNPADTLPWAWPFAESIAEAEDRARRTFSYEEAGRYLGAAESLPATNRTRWVALLMMYTGARGEEIAQLSPSDVTNIGGIWCLTLHDREWRTLKNSGSHRTVPIHKKVLDQGFLEFVGTRRGRQLLFADRPATKKTNSYKRVSGDLSKLLRKSAHVTDSRVVPYSSRHTVTSCLRLIEAPKFVEDRILGHKSAENKISYEYGEDQIHVLKKWIDQIDPLDDRRTTTTFKEDDD
jgi:integrase